MMPGAIALTRTPTGASSLASDRVNCAIAPFDTEYSAEPGGATYERIEAMLMIVPLLAFNASSMAMVTL